MQDETRECGFSENELEDLWLPLLNRLRVPIEQALRDARLKPSRIDSLVLVGGASQMPLVQRIAVRILANYRIKVTIRAPLSRSAQQCRPPAAYAVKILKR
ncbi:Hsp70 family protein [Escherichia coli]